MKPYGFEPVRGVDDARAWGCTCGPVAIAGALDLPLDEVRPAVEVGGRFRGYMGVRDVKRSLAQLGATIVSEHKRGAPVEADPRIGELLQPLGHEHAAIVMVRFCGPWDSIPRAAATFRHLFAYRHAVLPTRRQVGAVLDINNGPLIDMPEIAPWQPLGRWAWLVLGALLPERGDGRVVIDWAAEVRR